MDCGRVTFRGAAVQFIATISIATLSCLVGLLLSWPSYNAANFVSNDTVLSEPMATVHVTLLGALPNIGPFFLTSVYGVLMNRIGRKNTSIVMGLPYVIAWTILSITNSLIWVLIAMTIAGCGTAGIAVASIYIAEIAHDSIRGAMTSFAISIHYFGILISYFLGGILTYKQMIYVQLSISLLYILMVYLIKESPVYLLQNGREKEAAQSLAFYRQTCPSSEQVQNEILNIKLQLDPNLEKILNGERDLTVTEEVISTSKHSEKISEWQFLRKSKTSIRALIVGLATMAVMVLMGNGAFQVFAETLFKEALPSLDSNTCSIWFAVDLLVASTLCAFLIERLGRKFLMIFTCIASSICTLVLGLQIQFHWAPEWFTALLIYLYNFIFNIGVAVIPFVLVGELFLPDVRGLCGSIVLTASWGLNFITLLIFTPAVENYGFAPVFYGFTVIGFAGAIYCVFYQPETKGLSIDLIQGLFLKKTKRRVSNAVKYVANEEDTNETIHS